MRTGHNFRRTVYVVRIDERQIDYNKWPLPITINMKVLIVAPRNIYVTACRHKHVRLTPDLVDEEIHARFIEIIDERLHAGTRKAVQVPA